MSRDNHYSFAHHYLPMLLWEGKYVARVLFGPDSSVDEAEEFLYLAWNRCAEKIDEEDPLPGDEIRVSIHGLDHEYRAAVISLPSAVEPTEAEMVAIVSCADRPTVYPSGTGPALRYFTLELSIDRTTRERSSLLCEWTPSGAHLNYGSGPPPTVPAFLEAIHGLLKEPKKPEAAFIPLERSSDNSPEWPTGGLQIDKPVPRKPWWKFW
jgi:hypothetical protein